MNINFVERNYITSIKPKYENEKKLKNVEKNDVMTSSRLMSVPFSVVQGYLPSFGALAISSPELEETQSVTNENIDFSNSKEFAAYLDKRLNEDLMIISDKDIQNIINSVSEKTGLDEKSVAQITSRLTQFSSYAQLPALQKFLEEEGIVELSSICTNTVTLSDVLNYLSEHKHQMNFNNYKTPFQPYSGVILDDVLVEELAKAKEKIAIAEAKDRWAIYKTENALEYELLDNINSHNNSFYIIDGWNVKINGKDVSYGMFGTKNSLEENVEEIARYVQENKVSIDEALNGEIIKQAKEVLGKNTQIKIIKNPFADRYVSAYSISKRMAPLKPSKEHIKAVIDCYSDKTSKIPHENKLAKSVLSKYLDKNIACFSAQRLTDILQKKYATIQNLVENNLNKSMDDVVFAVPAKFKSFSLVTYQFLKSNNIKPEQVINYDGYPNNNLNLKNKVVVVLDDIVGSGDSLVQQQFRYNSLEWNEYKNTMNIIFAPIVSLTEGAKNIKNYIKAYNREGKDFFVPSILISDVDKLASDLTPKETEFLFDEKNSKKLFGRVGYLGATACTAMPYMLPDNNCEVSNSLLFPVLNDKRGSKQTIYENLENEIKKYM